MEYFELMQHLRHQGRITLISVSAIASVGCWLKLGVQQITIIILTN
ncbi:hypothetical protein [Gloeocapsopsis crepidinum]|nr:hypothetical protein [Gloeocapsopsis crepidinum]